MNKNAGEGEGHLLQDFRRERRFEKAIFGGGRGLGLNRRPPELHEIVGVSFVIIHNRIQRILGPLSSYSGLPKSTHILTVEGTFEGVELVGGTGPVFVRRCILQGYLGKLSLSRIRSQRSPFANRLMLLACYGSKGDGDVTSARAFWTDVVRSDIEVRGPLMMLGTET